MGDAGRGREQSADPGPPDSGLPAVPSLIERMTPNLRMTQLGNGFAVLSVATSTGALVSFPQSADTGSGWAITAVVCSALMLAICALQLAAWRRGMAHWRGSEDLDLAILMRASWVAHLVSYPVVLVGLYASIAGSARAGWSSAAALLLALTCAFLVVAQVLAGVQYLRTSGPPGTIPAYLRRLSRLQR